MSSERDQDRSQTQSQFSIGWTIVWAVLGLGLIWVMAMLLHEPVTVVAPVPRADQSLIRVQGRLPSFLSPDRLVRIYKRKLSIPDRVVAIRVEPDHQVFQKDKGVEAFVTRVGEVCLVRFMPGKERDERTVAHEVCHCALDFDYLVESGWHHTVTKEAAAVREQAAWGCALGLVLD